MSAPKFVDCNGLAGFMSLGMANAGMKMQGRVGTLEFGNRVAEANRSHFGSDDEYWDAWFSDNPDDWPDFDDTDAVVGCPPCSGWTPFSGPTYRGPDSPAHAHTRAFVQYAARQQPTIVAFECVQQAYTQGRAVMLQYREMLEQLSGREYDLYHVKHNNLRLGGFSFRPRYFWVAVEKGLPFGAHCDDPKDLPKIMEVIGDLAKIPYAWGPQKYAGASTQWTQSLRNQSGMVDGHIGRTNIHAQRVHEVFTSLSEDDGWKANESLGDALKKAVAEQGEFPPSWKNLEENVRRKDYRLGFSTPYRWSDRYWANVLTGSALDHVVHPTEPRLITHREAARMQGLPDSWVIEPLQNYSALPAVWGKAVPVQAATWLGEAVNGAIQGNPTGPQGELIGDREWLLDLDKGFSRESVRKRWYAS
jgi:site-specific DNA-cytosine methylase